MKNEDKIVDAFHEVKVKAIAEIIPESVRLLRITWGWLRIMLTARTCLDSR